MFSAYKIAIYKTIDKMSLASDVWIRARQFGLIAVVGTEEDEAYEIEALSIGPVIKTTR